ncbi:MAG: quinolinate synthase NadA [Candidatus Adiutrix sp.]|jgi:quinolinate synthase|nr:quinolinate synthase NadA [Candidatus Adiutrix sp.]
MPADREIEDLKALARDRRAVILSHYYCPPEVQAAADFVGDSLGLSQTAATTEAEAIVFAGVHFMAETASILCPDKKVILVNPEAGCPMADMITAPELMARKAELPGVAVLTYVNSPAEVKALSDLCCTSANVVAALRSLEAGVVLMTPDQNLAAFAQKQVPEKRVIYWDGLCPTHHRLRAETVRQLKAAHPGAPVLAHPECRPDVLELADFIGSTSAIIRAARFNPAREFVILTEIGVSRRLGLDNPGKVFHFPEGLVCPNMKKNTPADLRRALETLEPEVRVSPDIRRRSLTAIEKMLQLA